MCDVEFVATLWDRIDYLVELLEKATEEEPDSGEQQDPTTKQDAEPEATTSQPSPTEIHQKQPDSEPKHLVPGRSLNEPLNEVLD